MIAGGALHDAQPVPSEIAYADMPKAWRDYAGGLLNDLRRRALSLMVLGVVGAAGSTLLAAKSFGALGTGRVGGGVLIPPLVFVTIAAWGFIGLRVWMKARQVARSGGEALTVTVTTTDGARTDAIRRFRRFAGAQRVGLELKTATEIGAAALRSAWESPLNLAASETRGIVFGSLARGEVVLMVCEKGALTGTVRTGWRRPPLPDEMV
jgi:hypothetical protein